jgi:hypothetical protein
LLGAANCLSSSRRFILKKLEKYRKEVRSGLHEGSVVSTASVDTINSRDVWDVLRRELETIGLSSVTVTENQPFITDWLRDAFMRGEMEEDIPTELSTPQLPHTFSPSLLSGSTNYADTESALSPTPTRHKSPAVGKSLFRGRFLNHVFGRPDDVPRQLEITTSSTDKFLTPSKSRKSRLSSLMFTLFGSDLQLIQAASDGNADRVAHLIQNGANVNAKDKWDWRPMSMAAYGGHPDIARLLIKVGADLEYRDVDGDTPLDLATNRGHTAVVVLIQEELTRRAMEAG